jgi:hypothetical protein
MVEDLSGLSITPSIDEIHGRWLAVHDRQLDELRHRDQVAVGITLCIGCSILALYLKERLRDDPR